MVASPEWWEGIYAYTEGVDGVIGEVDASSGVFHVVGEDDRQLRFGIRGDPDDYIPGFRIHVLQSLPPPGHVPESGRGDISKIFFAKRGKDAPVGLVVEIWMEE